MAPGLRKEIALGCRILGDAQQGDYVWGHLSARDPDGRGTWMKAAGWGFEEVTADRTVLVDGAGQVLAGDGRRHAEYPIHTEIMARRPDVHAVVHTHSRAAVALAATGRPLEPVCHEGAFFTPPDVPRFTDTGDLILTRALGARLADCLGDRPAVLMVDHGVAVAAGDVRTAVVATLLLDAACEMQLRVLGAGGAVWRSSEAEARAKRAHCYGPALIDDAWNYLVRRLRLPTG